jgi:hypothetical protein
MSALVYRPNGRSPKEMSRGFAPIRSLTRRATKGADWPQGSWVHSLELGMERKHADVVQLRAWHSGLDRPKPLDGVSDLLDRPHARVFVITSRNARDRVVVNAGARGNPLPRPVTLEQPERRFNLLESHAHGLILGVSALEVNASAPNSAGHDSGMPKKAKNRAPAKTAFQANLRAIIGETSVNAWSNLHKLEQTTIQRLVDGADPKLSMIERIAAATGYTSMQLVSPDLKIENRQVLTQTIQDIEGRLEALLADTKAARDGIAGQHMHGDASAPVDVNVSSEALTQPRRTGGRT